MSAPNRIREIREAKDMTIESLAEAAGLSVSYVSRLESGGRNLSVKNLNLIAMALAVDPKELLAREGTTRRNVIPVVGKIGAGGAIDTSSEQIAEGEPLYEIEAPFPLPEFAIAFVISGDSMWPRYDSGDVIVCSRIGKEARTVLGFEAAVATQDGSRYLKRVLRGSRAGLFDLESHNAPPMRDVRLTWISDILAVVRASQVHSISNHAKRQLKKQISNGSH